MKIIFVCIGNFQEYIIHNIKNLQLFGNTDITVLTDAHFFNLLQPYNVNLIDVRELDDLNYYKNNKQDTAFRDGFWAYCSLRLFYLYSYIKKYNIENCIHLENDVMTYVNFDEISDHFDIENCVYVAFDCETRVIPGIIFIPNYQAFTSIIENYNYSLNDMENLARDDVEPLPIIPKMGSMVTRYNKNYKGVIYDTAAIGQYLGGIDERNQPGDTRGFINETCVVQYDKYPFFWIKINDLYVPHAQINNEFIKIINLHIHSKKLSLFMADNPLETKFISFV